MPAAARRLVNADETLSQMRFILITKRAIYKPAWDGRHTRHGLAAEGGPACRIPQGGIRSLLSPLRGSSMKSRAAVAFQAGQPLQIVELDVAPPRKSAAME